MKSNLTEIPAVKIGKHDIGPGHPVFIVAELSANHRQNFDEAIRLIKAAKEAGADAVKLQTYTPDTMTIDHDGEAFRHGRGSLWEGQTLYELYRKAYMPWEWQPQLKKVANELELELFSSAYDATSVDFLMTMDIPAIKISSFELIDLPLIRRAALTGKPLIISTGMATLAEIEQAAAVARSAGATEIVLLKCTSAYPADAGEMNLITISHLAQKLRLPCGISDHSKGTVVAAAAVALGACLIEKHFTLTRDKESIDGAFSLSPEEFKEMVDSVRIIEKAIGKIEYGPQTSELQSMSFRRSLYAVEDISTGQTITRSNIRSIRPSGGLFPDLISDLLDKQTRKAVKKGSPITWHAFK